MSKLCTLYPDLLLQIGIVPNEASHNVHVAILAGCLESCVSIELHINGAHSLLQHLLHLHYITTGCPLHQLFYWIGRLVHLKHVAQQQRNILYEDTQGWGREKAKGRRGETEDSREHHLPLQYAMYTFVCVECMNCEPTAGTRGERNTI